LTLLNEVKLAGPSFDAFKKIILYDLLTDSLLKIEA